MTALKNKKYNVFCYDANKVFITKLNEIFVLRDFSTTANTIYIRFVVQESAVDVNGWQMFLRKGIYGSFLTYKNNYIHHNHRGGMTIGVNDMFIICNHFYNNGEAYDYENNLPGFEQWNGQPFFTRYHINMEDSQGFNINIIDNRFDNGRLGIAARGYNYVISRNVFKNTSLVIYRLQYLTLTNNYFDKGSFDSFSYNDYVRNWNINENIIDGNFSLNGTVIVGSVINNVISGQVAIYSEVKVFRNNTFKVEQDIGYSEHINIKTVSLIDGCTFEKSDTSTAKNSILLENALMSNCTFKNLKVRAKDITIFDSIIKDTGFDLQDGSFKMENCKINQGQYLLKNNYETQPENSAIINIRDNTKPINLELKNCEIISTSSQAIFGSFNNALTNANLRLENTKITKLLNNKLGLRIFNGTLTLIKTAISSDVVVPAQTPNPSLIHQFSDCKFTNVSFNVKTTDVLYSQQDIGVITRPLSGADAPQTIPQKIGQEYYDITNKKLNKAFGTTAGTDWILI